MRSSRSSSDTISDGTLASHKTDVTLLRRETFGDEINIQAKLRPRISLTVRPRPWSETSPSPTTARWGPNLPVSPSP